MATPINTPVPFTLNVSAPASAAGPVDVALVSSLVACGGSCPPPAGVVIDWNATVAGGATISNASGNADINETGTLPPGGSIQFTGTLTAPGPLGGCVAIEIEVTGEFATSPQQAVSGCCQFTPLPPNPLPGGGVNRQVTVQPCEPNVAEPFPWVLPPCVPPCPPEEPVV
ncbi:hypothetical protein [Synechococcus phage Ssp-JY38]|nr:hypothetical protein [Synechococcus phage Yong-L2-223]